jgi:hypothetical protein
MLSKNDRIQGDKESAKYAEVSIENSLLLEQIASTFKSLANTDIAS